MGTRQEAKAAVLLGWIGAGLSDPYERLGRVAGPGATLKDAPASIDHQVRIAPGPVPLRGCVERIAGRGPIDNEAEPPVEGDGGGIELVACPIVELHRPG